MNDALLLLGTFYDNICSTFYTLNEIIAIYIKSGVYTVVLVHQAGLTNIRAHEYAFSCSLCSK